MEFQDLSFQGMAFTMILLGIALVFIKQLRMPKQYYENREIFNQVLKERIQKTPNYFGVLKEKSGEMIQEDIESEEDTQKE